MSYDDVDVEDLMVEQDQVVQAQRRFDDAELSDDRPVLEELLHEEFLSIGPKGFLLDKRQWIDRHEHFAYHELQVDEMDVRMFGDAAIIRCVQRNHADSSGREVRIATRVSQNPGGDDGAVERLHAWTTPEATDTGSVQALEEMNAAMKATGAVLAGRRTVEQVDHWGGDHHGAPVFVVSHRPAPPSAAKYPMVTYVTDGIESAMAQAKAAAGDRDVFVHGAVTAQRALEAGVLDELQIHHVPVLLGAGLRQFDVLGSRVELDIVRVIDTPYATHIRYRVRR